jgi:hypothetical protein
MRREGKISGKKYVQFFTPPHVKFMKGCIMEKICRTNCLGKIILLLGMAARWHSTTVGKGGREAGGGGE